jgi:desulfoferrodoxin (superoxide reductase-like protein)
MTKFVALIGMACLLTVASVSAHAPKRLDAEFDTETHLLTVTAYHAVKDAAKHYVEKIEVELNGKRIVEQKFKSQPDLEKQVVLYMIADARVDDEIKVVAHCNISGKKSYTIEVEEKVKPEEEEGE